jgi:hypothetical protein
MSIIKIFFLFSMVRIYINYPKNCIFNNVKEFPGGEGNCPTALSILLRASGPSTRSPAHPCAGFYSYKAYALAL